MINKNFEERVNNFIQILINFNKSVFEKDRKIFNPWTEYDLTDYSSNAPKIRVENLEKYLINREKAQYILIAESPSKGARYTGIAMTSEKVIKNLKLSYETTSLKSKEKKYYIGEQTANKVWKELIKSNKQFVMWNAFAFNIHKKENKWFETPTEYELKTNLSLLETFISLYPTSKIIAIGNKAKNALSKLNIINCESVRHPSNDFDNAFSKEFSNYL